LRDVISDLLEDGVDHICLVNNHLEPEHDEAVRASIEPLPERRVSVATPLKKRWAHTLSDEFKRGACHAGKYETSILLAAAPDRVDRERAEQLDAVPISLSDNLREGVDDFREMGLDDAYAGAPAEASAEHGDEMLDRLADMIAGEVRAATEPSAD
jgi:creatinine amidohydrolase